MGGDMGSLYDAHADRLYVYCWSLVGDQRAAAAVGDTFTAAVHHPPRGDRVLWLYSLARTACSEHGAFAGGPAGSVGPTNAVDGRRAPLFAGAVSCEGTTPHTPRNGPDPLLRAAANLRADHREVLLLWAGEWLEPHDIALVLGIAPDTVAQLLNAARTRLERAVLELLMRGASEPGLDQFPLITAFEKGRLPQLLARRAPSRAPAGLRERVLAVCEAETTRPLPSVVAPSPLIVIGAEKGRRANDARSRRGLSGGVSKGLGAAAGVAASAAAVIGLLASWPSAKGGGGSASLVPTSSSGKADPAAVRTGDGPRHPLPGLTGSERVPNGPQASSDDDPLTKIPGVPPWRDGAEPGSPQSASPTTSPSGKPSGGREPTDTPPHTPGKPTTPPGGGGTTDPTTPPDGGGGTTDPTTPPDDGGGSTEPTTPPEDPPPTEDPGTSSPSPETNPAPSPEPGPSQG
ncbi:hypothetical protein GCM10022254_65080 [Actinomadura meridiana]|uniref:Uncharacterized protein n=1 Tax=Actinomadura meridiana TaxID=559626 RepID=A0ABP8CL59_9ACTN